MIFLFQYGDGPFRFALDEIVLQCPVFHQGVGFKSHPGHFKGLPPGLGKGLGSGLLERYVLPQVSVAVHLVDGGPDFLVGNHLELPQRNARQLVDPAFWR